jgi:hypothetical protein
VPEQRVPWSGIYRVHQDSHRLMQEGSLRAGENLSLLQAMWKQD